MSEEEWKRYIVLRLCEEAARRADLEMLKALRAGGYPWSTSTCARAGAGGHLEVLNWLRAKGCP